MGDIDKTLCEKYYSKYLKEKQDIMAEIKKSGIHSSNLEKCIDIAVKLCAKLSDLWKDAKYHAKRNLQKMLFPDGITYNLENHTFRTRRVNSFVFVLNKLSDIYTNKKTGTITNWLGSSGLVELPGVEPGSKQVTNMLSTCLVF